MPNFTLFPYLNVHPSHAARIFRGSCAPRCAFGSMLAVAACLEVDVCQLAAHHVALLCDANFQLYCVSSEASGMEDLQF